MTETPDSSRENKEYNDEASLLDGLYEFHPEFFEQLSADELEALESYYLVGQEVPDNVFDYRKELIKNNLQIESTAKVAFSHLKKIAKIN